MDWSKQDAYALQPQDANDLIRDIAANDMVDLADFVGEPQQTINFHFTVPVHQPIRIDPFNLAVNIILFFIVIAFGIKILVSLG
jgi:hypothetical protein